MEHVQYLWLKYNQLIHSPPIGTDVFPNLTIPDSSQSTIDLNQFVNLISNILINVNSIITCNANRSSVALCTGDITSQFSTMSSELYQALLSLSSALLRYRQELDGTVAWLNGTSESLSQFTVASNLLPSASLLNSFYGNATYFATQFARYLSADISQLTFATNVNDQTLIGNMMNSANGLVVDIDRSVWTVLRSVVDSKQALISNSYKSLMSKFSTLRMYLYSDETIGSFLRTRRIWQRPVFSQQASKVRLNI